MIGVQYQMLLANLSQCPRHMPQEQFILPK